MKAKQKKKGQGSMKVHAKSKAPSKLQMSGAQAQDNKGAEGRLRKENGGFILKEGEIVFLAKFFAIFLALEAIVNILDFSALQEFIAKSLAAVLDLRSSHSTVFVQGGSFEINASCTGLVSSSVLAAVVFSLKKPDIRSKAIIFISGSLLLLLLNYLRVLVVLWAGKEFGTAAAEALHIASWFTTTAFVLGLWYYFTKKVTGSKSFADFM